MSSRSSSRSFQPPQFKGFHCVGWIPSAHGLRGEVFVRLYAGRADWLEDLESLHLLKNKQNQLSEVIVDSARPHKDGLIVVLQGVLDRNASEALAKSGVYISEALLESDSQEDGIYLKQILGFQLTDLAAVNLGEIVGFATNGPQDLLEVKRPGSERVVLVPFVEAFLRHIDFDKRQVTMELPEGLFDLEDK